MTGPSIGVKGTSVSPGGTGVRGIDIATTGPTTGVSSYVNSAAGTSAVFENAAGGQIISGRINGGHEIFSVDGSGNVNTAGSLNLAYGAYKSAGVIVLNAPANTNNTFVGGVAGLFNTTGDYDTFVGEEAGLFNTSGRNDLYIANQGPSSGTESNAIRIGTQGNGAGQQTAAYIAGIYGSSVGGSGIAVYVDNNGQLGTVVSSRRFKEQIADMGDSTSALMKLRPVTFLYKPEYSKGDRTLQYGLIAEEVAQVYPELVAYDNDGQPYTVRYQYLTPMLLNELQKEHAVVTAQQQELQTQLQQIKTQRQEIDGLKLQLQQQNASLQRKNASLEERLTKLESYVATQTRVQTASDVQPVATASPSGDSQ
jgi:hypothetical protein